MCGTQSACFCPVNSVGESMFHPSAAADSPGLLRRRYFRYCIKRGEIMHKQQKESLNSLRSQGYSYSEIAQLLCISINTVKSYCRRHDLNKASSALTETKEPSFCHHCGIELAQVNGRKQKRFCSDKCRMAWWNAHTEKIDHRTVMRFVCKACGKEFSGHGTRPRKYCSRACYGRSKVVSV